MTQPARGKVLQGLTLGDMLGPGDADRRFYSIAQNVRQV